MATVCSFFGCCMSEKKKYMIPLLGLESDQEYVLQKIIKDFQLGTPLRPYSEHVAEINGKEMIMLPACESKERKELRDIQLSTGSAVVFPVDIGNKKSMEVFRELISEEFTTPRIILVLCRSLYNDTSSIEEVKKLCNNYGHGRLELKIFDDEHSQTSIATGFDWICNRLEG